MISIGPHETLQTAFQTADAAIGNDMTIAALQRSNQDQGNQHSWIIPGMSSEAWHHTQAGASAPVM